MRLNLADADAVRRAYRAIEAAVSEQGRRRALPGRDRAADGPACDGYELILGSSIDPQFGPVLLFGAGGQLVEVFKDRALALPPLNTTLARRHDGADAHLHRAARACAAAQPVDLAALEQLLVRFSQLVVEQPLDQGDRHQPAARVARAASLALDARVVLHGAGRARRRPAPPGHPALPGAVRRAVDD